MGLPVLRVKYSPSVVDNCIGGAKKCLASSFIKNMLRNIRLLLIVVTSFSLCFLAGSRMFCTAADRAAAVAFLEDGLTGWFRFGSNVTNAPAGLWTVVGGNDGQAPPSRFSRSVRWSVTNLIGWRLSLYLRRKRDAAAFVFLKTSTKKNMVSKNVKIFFEKTGRYETGIFIRIYPVEKKKRSLTFLTLTCKTYPENVRKTIRRRRRCAIRSRDGQVARGRWTTLHHKRGARRLRVALVGAS